MTIFVSYSSADDDAVTALVADLEMARHTVWLDRNLKGGQAWWVAILEHIRGCSVFVFALSENSLTSKPCLAEASYAQALGIPVLPVQIGEVGSYRTNPIFATQAIDYRQKTSAAGIALIGAVNELAARPRQVPDPLPAEPPIPYEYLLMLGKALEATEPIAPAGQAAILTQLRQAIHDEHDAGVRTDVRKLLLALRNRSDTTYPTVREIDEILGVDQVRQTKPKTATTRPHQILKPPRADDTPIRAGYANRGSPVLQTMVSALLIVPTLPLYLFASGSTSMWGAWASYFPVDLYFVVVVGFWARFPNRRWAAVAFGIGGLFVDRGFVALGYLALDAGAHQADWFLRASFMALPLFVAAWGIGRRQHPLWLLGLIPAIAVAGLDAWLSTETSLNAGLGWWLLDITTFVAGCLFCWGFERLAISLRAQGTRDAGVAKPSQR
jgi:hypothetical protein